MRHADVSLPADDRGALTAPSVACKIHREVVLLAGWGRAILLQLAHPLVAQGVADHSVFTTERWGRLRRLDRTLRAMLTLTFGTADEAAQVAARINRIHDRVHGQLGEAAGPLARGTPYSARDPALLEWVHATLVDSFLRTYDLFVGPLTEDERDRYCAEASGNEALLGIPAGRLPRSMVALRAYMDQVLASGVITVTDTARGLAREIVQPPVPRIAAPLVALARLPIAGLLPPPIREGYGLRWSSRHARALAVTAGVVRRGLPLLPGVLREWPQARTAARRERGRPPD